MVEINLSLLALEEMPITDEKKEKPRVNLVQENLNYLITKKNLTPSQIQRETSIPWGTLQGWLDYSVKTQLLDINIKELADFLEVSIDELAFVDLRERDSLN
jgi:hypothetical protein